MRTRLHWLLVLFAFAIPIPGSACEPIFPMFDLLSGPTAGGASLLNLSLFGLAVAVAIKCAAFALLEKRLPWQSAVIYMLLANVVSTIPGVFVAACISSIGGFFFALPIVALLGWLVSSRLISQTKWSGYFGTGACTLAFVVFFFVSAVMYGFAQGALDNNSYGSYWLFKFLFVTLVACTGIVISAVLEECVVARLSRKSIGNLFFTLPFFARTTSLLYSSCSSPHWKCCPNGSTRHISSFLGSTPYRRCLGSLDTPPLQFIASRHPTKGLNLTYHEDLASLL